MNYTQSITRRHRTAFVLAIDQSGSMVEELEFRGRRTSKAAAVAEVANSLLSELLLRATREGEVRDYYDIAVVGYSGEGVHSLLSADETFVPVSALRNAVRNTRRVSVERRLPDGQPAFNEVTVSEWIAPAASGQTPMYEALLYVHDLVEAWCRRPEHRESFPPLVFNITDGEASDSDEEELAQIAGRIRSLGTDDGRALLVNIHLASGDAAKGRIFLTDGETAYNNRYARLLYDISSPMPRRSSTTRSVRSGATRPRAVPRHVLQRIDYRTALDPQRRVDQRKSPIAMFPTIHRFMEGLLSPRTSLRTLSEARFAQDGTGALLLERTTLFAEAQCTLGDRRLRLFCPLSPARPPARGDHGATPQISSGRIPAPVADAARRIHLHRRHRHAAHLRPGRAGTSRRGRAARNGSRPRRPRPSALGARYPATAVGAGRPDAQPTSKRPTYG